METLYKCKLSKHLSYPFGLEALSEQLRGVPQAGQISVRFSDVSDLKNKTAMLGRHRILDCRYCPHDEHKWQLSIYPVTREAKPRIRELLIEEGIPRVRAWFEPVRSDFWLSDLHYLAVFFDVRPDELIYEEPC